MQPHNKLAVLTVTRMLTLAIGAGIFLFGCEKPIREVRRAVTLPTLEFTTALPLVPPLPSVFSLASAVGVGSRPGLLPQPISAAQAASVKEAL